MLFETVRQTSPSVRRHNSLRQQRAQQGAIAMMTPLIIIVMLAMLGMALDLSRSYNRKAELHTAADAAALVAASALDGTPAGIDKAADGAQHAAEANNFAYGTDSILWSSAALTFGTGPDGGSSGWVDAATAKGNASKVFFARIDTSALDAKHGSISNFFMPVLSTALAQTNVAASAVAGRDSLNVLPLGICANSNKDAAALSSGELVEYGFRRGVSYDLMNLNPGGQSPENFLLNPVAPAGTVGTTMMNRMDVVAPFICTGKMAIPTLRGGELSVERGFPIASLYVHLNSRFGTYATPCTSLTAPADPVVKKFDLDSATWMKDRPDGLSANAVVGPQSLLTVAEQPAGATKTSYGPLWSYAKAVQYSDYVAKKGIEPASGYAPFSSTDWSLLYNPGMPQAQSYPNTPYQAAGGSATYKSYRNTRVLHVPLLHCPVPAGASTTAAVVGIAKFFMTVSATSSALYAEFAGMDTETALGGNVRLYQ
jgi:hypothetical protein